MKLIVSMALMIMMCAGTWTGCAPTYDSSFSHWVTRADEHLDFSDSDRITDPGRYQGSGQYSVGRFGWKDGNWFIIEKERFRSLASDISSASYLDGLQLHLRSVDGIYVGHVQSDNCQWDVFLLLLTCTPPRNTNWEGNQELLCSRVVARRFDSKDKSYWLPGEILLPAERTTSLDIYKLLHETQYHLSCTDGLVTVTQGNGQVAGSLNLKTRND